MEEVELVEGDPESEQLFVRFRERVFAAIQDSIAHYTVPLIIQGDAKILEHRSGVLLQIADMHFLVTAGHDMVQHSESGYPVGIALPDKGSHPILLVDETFWTTKDDREDLSVTQLTPLVVEFLKTYYRYARLSDVMSRHHPNQGQGLYLIYGFPYALVGPDETGIKRIGDWRYLTIPFQGDCSVVEKYDPALHLVLAYERGTHSQDGDLVHPPGMSGCGIWFVGTHLTRSLFSKDDFRLVAIQNRWWGKYEYAKGTWIDSVLTILWKYYPETHKPLLLAGFNFVGC